MDLELAGWIYSLTWLLFFSSGHFLLLQISVPRIIIAFVMSLLTIIVTVWYSVYTAQYGFLFLLAGVLLLTVIESRMVLNANQDS